MPTKKSDRTWTDQPTGLEGKRVLGTLRVAVNSQTMKVEVREGEDGAVWMTAGNLFQSETLYCPTEGHALRALFSLGKSLGVPAGCIPADNARDSEVSA
jgi:hypothetical protein